jgi:hypothetical protein
LKIINNFKVLIRGIGIAIPLQRPASAIDFSQGQNGDKKMSISKRLVCGLLGGLAIALSGCIFVHDDEPSDYTEISFDFTYYGLDCLDAYVDTTRIRLYDGIVLVDEVFVDCPDTGVTIPSLEPITYSFDIDAFSPEYVDPIYVFSGIVDALPGTNQVNVDLAPN